MALLKVAGISLVWGVVMIFPNFSASFETAPVVRGTVSGDLAGKWWTIAPGRTIEAYLAIPYAEPPVGPRRFKDPEPFGKWMGMYNATNEPTKCLQRNSFSAEKAVEGSEDCLFLNVYTPSATPSSGYPVMVFIHGGGFVDGDAASDLYGPQKLLVKDIILVTLHYRLGFLGFASLDDRDFAGNYGLKDQSLALQWVKNNIAKFGGDANKITVVGESAGAASAHYHVLSKKSQHLFQQAILMSGSADCPWAVSKPHQNGNFTAKMASFVNCSIEKSTTELLECLRKVDGAEFLKHNEKFLTVWKGKNVPIVVFRPVLESSFDNPFMTYEAYRASAPKPMMIGTTSAEGALVLAIWKRDQTKSIDEVLSELDKRFLEIIAVELEGDEEEFPEKRAANIREQYFGNMAISNETLPQLTKLYSDIYFLNGTKETIKRHKGDKYVYKFGYEGSYSLSQLISGDPAYRNGVSHADDLLYLFPMKPFLSARVGNETDKDKEMSAKMVDLFTNYVINGNPNSKSEPNVWTTTTEDLDFLSITPEGNLKMEKHYPYP
uniref:Carboxylic ester hydrolase n=1 Tax=Sogatella furcifera TaxID=113103 RepID=W5XNG9_SOGFU|nr:carboxylesterase [Sogatella furcifera]